VRLESAHAVRAVERFERTEELEAWVGVEADAATEHARLGSERIDEALRVAGVEVMRVGERAAGEHRHAHVLGVSQRGAPERAVRAKIVREWWPAAEVHDVAVLRERRAGGVDLHARRVTVAEAHDEQVAGVDASARRRVQVPLTDERASHAVRSFSGDPRSPQPAAISGADRVQLLVRVDGLSPQPRAHDQPIALESEGGLGGKLLDAPAPRQRAVRKAERKKVVGVLADSGRVQMPVVGGHRHRWPERELAPPPLGLPLPSDRERRGVDAEHGARFGGEVVPAKHQRVAGYRDPGSELPERDVAEIGGERGMTKDTARARVVHGQSIAHREDLGVARGEVADVPTADAPGELVIRRLTTGGEHHAEEGGAEPGTGDAASRANGRSRA
jgi:hypothetical protein